MPTLPSRVRTMQPASARLLVEHLNRVLRGCLGIGTLRHLFNNTLPKHELRNLFTISCERAGAELGVRIVDWATSKVTHTDEILQHYDLYGSLCNAESNLKQLVM